MLGIINNTKLFQYKKKQKNQIDNCLLHRQYNVSLMEKLIRYADMINALKLRD